MTKSMTGRGAVLICVATLALALGCASDKDAPVYDTAANPHGLPAQACDLIDAIEAGQLVNYDVITESFGRLYLENQELLENKHWKEIITRLGGKFHRRADELIKQGVPSYSQAAGFYMLASFSAPDDSELAKTAALFTTWKEMMEKIDYDYIPSPTSSEFTDRLDFLRCFVLGDSLERKFAEEYLVHQLLDSIVSSRGSDDQLSLSSTDRALLLYLGITKDTRKDPLRKRGNPSLRPNLNPPVQPIAFRLVAVGPLRVRAELYFKATEAISEDFLVAITMDTVGEDSSVRTHGERQYIHFEPLQPTSSWMPGQVQPAAIEVAYGAGMAWLEYTFSRKSLDADESVTFEVVRPPLTARQPLTVERFSRR